MTQLLAYQKRVSGPLMDRIDLIVHVNRASEEDFLFEQSPTDPLSDKWRSLVESARQRQHNRHNKPLSNAQLNGKQLAKL